MSKHGLGRRQSTDVRDHRFLMERPVELPAIIKKSWSMGKGQPWDQGNSSMCVSFSTNGYLVASPIRNKIPQKNQLLAGAVQANLSDWLKTFYKEAQRNDEWPGENYDGTSVRGAFKVLQNLGFISEYRWAFDINTIINQILLFSPVVVGTDWTESMFDTIKMGKYKNFIQVSPDGKYDVSGGHAYLLIGVDRQRKCPDNTLGAFRILNSWGKSWGDSGRAWISIVDFGILLNHQGEAAIAVEILL